MARNRIHWSPKLWRLLFRNGISHELASVFKRLSFMWFFDFVHSFTALSIIDRETDWTSKKLGSSLVASERNGELKTFFWPVNFSMMGISETFQRSV